MAKHLTVSDYMSFQVTSVNVEESLPSIIKLMHQKRISCLIVEEQQHPVGIITERGIVHYIAQHPDVPHAAVTAKEISPAQLITVNQNDSLFEAMVLCRNQHIKHLAVVDDSAALVGVITYSDLVDANFSEIERQATLLGNSCDNEDINAQLLQMTLTDPLLDIGNRRAMEIDLKQTHDLCMRYHRSYAIALIDVDFFKKYNDFYGHMAGDKALQQFAQCVKGGIRNSDRLYRYGGEELLLLMPETPPEAASIVAERIIDATYKLNLCHEQSPFGRVTTSVGISGYRTDTEQAAEIATIIEEADKALYCAKEGGRNQLKSFDDISPSASSMACA